MKKRAVHILSSIFPSIFTKIAYNQLTNPQVKKLREHELITLNKAKKEDFIFNEFIIKTYLWGDKGEEIFFIHGWEGQAGNFSDIIGKLLKKGFRIRAFDAPSHGFSSRGSTSLFEFTELVAILIRKFGSKKLISHSFGGVATSYALYNNPDLEIDKYALITTPDKFIERINDVSNAIGISKKVVNRLIQKLEKENDFDVSTLNVSDFVKNVNVKKALIIHDKNDKVIPIRQSKNVYKNWAAAEFEEIEGTGHFRILRTESVIDRLISFIEK